MFIVQEYRGCLQRQPTIGGHETNSKSSDHHWKQLVHIIRFFDLFTRTHIFQNHAPPTIWSKSLIPYKKSNLCGLYVIEPNLTMRWLIMIYCNVSTYLLLVTWVIYVLIWLYFSHVYRNTKIYNFKTVVHHNKLIWKFRCI